MSDEGFGGRGWIINPDGKVLATTDEKSSFVTIEIDLKEAETAKTEYPRYIND